MARTARASALWLMALLAPSLLGAMRLRVAHRARATTLLPSRRTAAARRSGVALSASEPRELADGDFHMWSPEPDVHKLGVRTKGWECTFETGRIARLAGGAVLMQAGDNVIFASACFQAGGSPADFVPLKVDYQERYSAGGLTPGGYIKRDGRPGDAEILTARLIDRPIRPAFPKGWSEETQIISYVLSYDGGSPPDCMAVCASAAALLISDVPFDKPVACVRVTRGADGGWALNAPMAEQASSDVSLVIAGTTSAMLMIEGFCKFVPEADIVEACAFGHEAVREICAALGAWQAHVGKRKATELVRTIPEQVAAEVERICAADLERVLSIRAKQERERAFGELQRRVERELTAPAGGAPPAAPAAAVPAPAELARGADDVATSAPDATMVVDDYDEPPHAAIRPSPPPPPARSALELADVQLAFQKLATGTLRKMVKRGGVRPDGRSSTEVRKLAISTAVLPRTHGSALFTRGETQSLATVTLGDSSAEQKFEGLTVGAGAKRFYLHYSFPPFSVGEVGRFGGAPGRREVGHGNLAERALAPSMPTAAQFPYTVRIESLITMSCGSSSMASVCGGCLALMDAAVPIARPVAGVAMGLLFDESPAAEHVVLTDILGLEDALGSMDFKVAGDKDGVTALQLDVKCEGLDVPLLRTALAQAHEGRQHILSKMLEAQPGPRSSLPSTVMRITKRKFDPAHCGAIIGKGGETITSIIETSGVENIDLSRSDGVLTITAKTDEAVAAAFARIDQIVADIGGRTAMPKPQAVVGQSYTSEVKSVMPFGIFVELLPGLDGFCHISEVSESYVRKIEDSGIAVGDTINVVVTSKNEKGQYRVKRLSDGEGAAGATPADGAAQKAAGSAKRGNGGPRVGAGAPRAAQKTAPSGAVTEAALSEAALSAALGGLSDEPAE